MQVNGTTISSEKNQTLFDFLEAKNIDFNIIAVERNGEIVPRSTYKEVILSEEDTLEIVRFVGGG